MTPDEKFMFNLEGYLGGRNVLPKFEVDKLNQIAGASTSDQYEIHREEGLKLAKFRYK